MRHLFTTTYEVFREESVLGDFNRPKKTLVSKGKYRGKLDRKQARLIVGEPQNFSDGEYILYTSPDVDIKPSDIIKIDGMSFTASKPFRYRVHMEINLSISEEV